MKQQIVKPNGEAYANVWVEGEMLKINLLLSSAPNWTINIDAKAIPQLIEILETTYSRRME